MPALVGIFVGGQSRRMGGVAKGLLLAPDTGEPLVVRLARVASEALPDAEITLVGANDAYMVTQLPRIADAPECSGPIAGLVALLEAARDRGRSAVALACDMPRVSAALVRRVTIYASESDAVAARVGGIWQPFFARYAPERALPIARRLAAPFRVLEALGAVELPLTVEEIALLADWDRPEDVESR